MTTYTDNISDTIETINPIIDTRNYISTDLRNIDIIDKINPFVSLRVPCKKEQKPTDFVLFGNVLECEKIIFINYKNEIDATIVPDVNGDFLFYAPDKIHTYDIIFITNNSLKGNKVYRSILPVSVLHPDMICSNGESVLCDLFFNIGVNHTYAMGESVTIDRLYFDKIWNDTSLINAYYFKRNPNSIASTAMWDFPDCSQDGNVIVLQKGYFTLDAGTTWTNKTNLARPLVAVSETGAYTVSRVSSSSASATLFKTNFSVETTITLPASFICHKVQISEVANIIVFTSFTSGSFRTYTTPIDVLSYTTITDQALLLCRKFPNIRYKIEASASNGYITIYRTLDSGTNWTSKSFLVGPTNAIEYIKNAHISDNAKYIFVYNSLNTPIKIDFIYETVVSYTTLTYTDVAMMSTFSGDQLMVYDKTTTRNTKVFGPAGTVLYTTTGEIISKQFYTTFDEFTYRFKTNHVAKSTADVILSTSINIPDGTYSFDDYFLGLKAQLNIITPTITVSSAVVEGSSNKSFDIPAYPIGSLITIINNGFLWNSSNYYGIRTSTPINLTNTNIIIGQQYNQGTSYFDNQNGVFTVGRGGDGGSSLGNGNTGYSGIYVVSPAKLTINNTNNRISGGMGGGGSSYVSYASGGGGAPYGVAGYCSYAPRTGGNASLNSGGYGVYVNTIGWSGAGGSITMNGNISQAESGRYSNTYPSGGAQGYAIQGISNVTFVGDNQGTLSGGTV